MRREAGAVGEEQLHGNALARGPSCLGEQRPQRRGRIDSGADRRHRRHGLGEAGEVEQRAGVPAHLSAPSPTYGGRGGRAQRGGAPGGHGLGDAPSLD